MSVRERQSYRRHEELLEPNESGAHYDFLRKPLLYQVLSIHKNIIIIMNL